MNIVSQGVFMGSEHHFDARTEYRNCIFNDCTLVFHGTLKAVDCSFINCRWQFAGEATNTLHFLALLRSYGASDFVDSILEKIKNGQIIEEIEKAGQNPNGNQAKTDQKADKTDQEADGRNDQ